MADDRRRVNDGVSVQKGISEGMTDKNANYQPSVPRNYNPPPPIKVPPPPTKQSK